MRITTTLAVLAIAAMPGLTAVAASPNDPEWEREKTALIAMLGKEPTTEQVSTSLDWGRCLNRFVEQFAPQEEEIGTIAEAVINACMIEMETYLTAFQPIQDVVLRARARSKLISRIREIRSNAADK